MAGSVRVNLSVPERVDTVLSEYADLTGRTKAAVIMEAVGYCLRDWERQIRRERALLYQDNQRLRPRPSVGSPMVADTEQAAQVETASKNSGLISQEEWNLKEAQKKAAKAKAARG